MSAQTTIPRIAEYCQALRLYTTGEVDAAASIAAAWPSSEWPRVATAISVCRDDAATPEAAAMFETEIALRERDLKGVALHLAIVEQTISRFVSTDRNTKFEQHWYVLATSLYLAWTDPDRAAAFAARGLRRFKSYPQLHVLAGMAEEMRGHIKDGNLHDKRTIDAMPRSSAVAHLMFAETEYRRALTLDPELDDARLHLLNSVTLVDSMPVTVLMVLDTSGSVAGEKLQDLIDAGRGLLAALRIEDRAALVTFSERILVRQPVTSDHRAIAAAFSTLAGRGQRRSATRYGRRFRCGRPTRRARSCRCSRTASITQAG